jgi:BlaI family penicillinase repressor
MNDLTRAEEEIMQVLWNINKGFVKDILGELPEPKPAYNTVSTIVRILEKKNFVGHKSYGNSHQYYPTVMQENYSKHRLNKLATGYFNGSFKSMVSFFVDQKKLSINDLDQILSEIKSTEDGIQPQ